MKLGIMQPYLFPYIGYFQLINGVDQFIVYDNVKFTKGGWINRNRILVHGTPKWITLALRKDSDHLSIRDRYLSNRKENTRKLLRLIQSAYRKAPYFQKVYPLVEECLLYEEDNLFNFVLKSIRMICESLNISTPIAVSSEIPIDHSLRKQDKVIALCKFFDAKVYINLPGGKSLYDRRAFIEHGIHIYFLEPRDIVYDQGVPSFVPNLSIIDVLMHNGYELCRQYLTMYDLT